MSNYNFQFDFVPPAEVQVKKDVAYTITLIGGPEEYKKYMAAKELKLSEAKRTKEEAYAIKRSLYEDIVLGVTKASKEALEDRKHGVRVSVLPTKAEPQPLPVSIQKYYYESTSMSFTEKMKQKLGKLWNDAFPNN